MTYKEYQKALAAIDKSAKTELNRLNEQMEEVRRLKEKKLISEREAWERDQRLAEIFDKAKNRHYLKVEHLKMDFARQDIDIKIGDIIWAKTNQGTKVLKVTEIKMAAFDYPMLKFFGIQLTIWGLPAKVQKPQPRGGIYQKDITSINGEPYIYKTRN